MENILVSIRVRPLSKPEASRGNPWKLTSKSIALCSGVSSSGQTFNFDRVFDPSSKTIDIYDAHTKKIISSAVEGFNGTILAYGQTSSGKTFTMRGTPEEPGIIPLAVEDVFRNIKLPKDREFLLRVSYMEIYNEEIKDLLRPENCKLQIHENSERGIFVAGLQEEIVDSPEQVLALMAKGEAHRHVGETNMNVHSSRSHTIFRMVIESRDRSHDQGDGEDREILQNSDPVRVSHLNLVDLAGSERVAKTGAEGARLKEGTHINKSLMTLGTVINKLSDGIEKQGGHVPYRDSKLTRILQPALGGNARTVIICNITPALVHIDETKGTLQFASRANRVTNCAQVNEIVTDAALLKRQKKEIAELLQKLQNQESPSEQFEEEILNLRNELLKTELDRERMALELQEVQKAQAEKERRIKEQQQKIENLSTMVINSAVDDREFEKRSKRPTDAPKTPKPTASELSVNVRRERSFGLPPPFEVLMEEDEDMFTRGTSSFDDNFPDNLSMNDGFTLPEPGPKLSVSNRRRRSSNDWIVGNELEQQLLDLEGEYGKLQLDHVIKMSEKDSEIDKLKTELAQTQVKQSNTFNNGHKKVRDSERREKSLEGSQESESLATIRQLRAQVGRLETEKLYMGRELQRLEDEAREQVDMSRQYLKEVYEELNLAKETCAKLNTQLDTTLQEVHQLQMEKCENKVLHSQLSFALEDLKTELDDIRKPCGGIQSSMDESFQLLTIHVKAFQECVEGARGLSAHVVRENSTAGSAADTNRLDSAEDKLHLQIDHAACEKGSFLQRKANIQVELENLKTCLQEMEDEKSSLTQSNLLEERNVLLSAVNSLHMEIENVQSERDMLLLRKDALQNEKENLKTCIQVMEDERHSLSETHLYGEGQRNALLSAINSLQMGIEHDTSEKDSLLLRKATIQVELENLKACLQEMEAEKSSLTQINLQEERNLVLSAVNSLHIDIEEVETERGRLLLRKDVLQDELENLKTCIHVMEDERSSLSETYLKGEGERNTLLSAVNSLQTEIERASSEKKSLLLRNAVVPEELDNLKTCQTMEDEKSFFGGNRNSEDGIVEELLRLREENGSLGISLARAQNESESVAVEMQKSQLAESVLVERVENLELALQAVKEERSKYMKASELATEELDRFETIVEELAIKLAAGFQKCDKHYDVCELSGANGTMFILEVETLLVAIKQAASEEERLLLRESVLSEELDHTKSSLLSVEAEKCSLSRRLQQTQSELDRRKEEIDTIARKLRSSQQSNDVEERDELSPLVSEVERLIREKKVLEDRIDILHSEMLQSQKDVDRLSSKEASLEVELTRLKSSAEEVKDDRKLWMKVSEDRLADVERLTVELENTRRALRSTSEEFAGAQKQVSDLNSSLSQKVDEVVMLNNRLRAVEEEEDRLNNRLKDVEEQKNTLSSTVGQLERQLQDFEVAVTETLQETEGWRQRCQNHRAEAAALRKELATAKSLPAALLKEKDSLHRDLEKTKSKMKDVEAKLKTTIQDKNALETEKVNMERELKHLRQSNLLQRDISRRDSVVDQRRQSIALNVSKAKNQLSSVELALQLKTEEVEKLTYQLNQSHESYAKLEFAMAEAEGYSSEKLTQLERALGAMNDEKNSLSVTLERFQSDVNAVNEQYKASSIELENSRNELKGLKEKLQKSDRQTTAAMALVTAVTKEKDDIVEELLDAHMNFQRNKAELTAQAQESREKCDTLIRDVALLTEELRKLKELEVELNSYKEQCIDLQKQLRELQQHHAASQKQEQELRLSELPQLEQLRLELQECTMKLSTARDEQQMLSMENQRMIYANTVLDDTLDKTKGRLEMFEDQYEESEWELQEIKNLLQKAGFVPAEWNLVNLQRFVKQMKTQNTEAKKLETKLASKKMEVIDLEVELESMRVLFEKYEKEITFLKTRALTPEQETGVREIVRENKRFQSQVKKAEEKAQELMEMVKGKDDSLNALQTTLGSIRAQNEKLEKDLAASQAELESAQRLHKLALRAEALRSNSKLARAERLQPQATAQSARSVPSDLFPSSGRFTFRAESTPAESSLPGYRMPLSEKPSNESPPCVTERKRARLFPAAEMSKLSRSLNIGRGHFGLPESRSQVARGQEN